MNTKLRQKLFLFFTLFVCSTLVGLLVFNVFFLDSFYQNEKKSQLYDTADSVSIALDSDDWMSSIDKIKSISGFEIYLYSDDNQWFYGSQSGNINTISRGRNSTNGMGRNSNDRSDLSANLKKAHDYGDIYSVYTHPRWALEYLLYIRYSNGIYIVLETPIDNISDSAKTTQLFYMKFSAVMLIIGLIMAFFLSKYLEKKIYILQSQNAKLQADIEKEKTLEKMRREFIANVSHDLKTPISLIQGYAEGLKDEIVESKEDLNEYYNIIYDESIKMDNIVKELLELSKYESGGIKLNKTSTSLNTLLETIFSKYTLSFAEHSVISKLQIPDENIIADVDSHQLEKAISNLIDNALKNIDSPNNLSLKLSLSKNFIHISVFNTGSHIPESELNKIWDSFHKLDSSRSRSNGGHGLGLAIVKNIINLHGGNSFCENTDSGVVFTVTLPR
jgi:signal transduction histidine kinase